MTAQVDRNPQGHDPVEGHGAKHESPVGAQAPMRPTSGLTTPTNPEELVERVAVALYEQHLTRSGGDRWLWEALPTKVQDTWRDYARAAIDATPLVEMREALEKIEGLNDLSGVDDENVEAEARGRLYYCECLANDALRSLTGDRG